MNSRMVLLLSLALNLVCLVGLLWRNGTPETEPAPMTQVESTAVLVEPMPQPAAPAFRWSQVESTNYFAYIANLRTIGCPEQTIRDIISADLIAALRSSPAASPAGTSKTAVTQMDLRAKHSLAPQTLPVPLSVPGSHPLRSTATVRSTTEADNADVTQVDLLVKHLLHPQSVPLPGLPVQESLPLPSTETSASATDRFAEDEPAADILESRQVRRLKAIQRTWAVDWIRARYGIEALLGWQQQAVREGTSFDEFLQRHQVPVPPLVLR